MSTRNYSKELENIIQRNGTHRPRVLLHSCCGPCSSSVLEYLTQHFEVSLLWYNPNLFPEEEYHKRYRTQIELLDKMGLTDRVSVLAEPWRSEDYYAVIGGLEDEPEWGRRCTECFRLRLRECAAAAKARGFDYFCTTISVSRYKDAVRVNQLGEAIGEELGIAWLPSDFKKKNGEIRSQQLSEEYGIYRQNYCGCEFSLKNRQKHDAEAAAKIAPDPDAVCAVRD